VLFSPLTPSPPCSPALAAFDAEHDADTKALLENPFLADLGSLMRPTLASARISSTTAGAAAAAAAGTAANNAALADIDDLLGDDALFADLLTNASAASGAPAAVSNNNNDDDDALLASVALLGDGVRQSVPQIDGGTGTSRAGTASTASTASTSGAAAASGTSTVAVSRLDSTVIGSDDDDDEILGATAAAEVRDYIVCLYDDVKRAKTKRKLSLLDGVASVQGVDYVFRKGAGECDFQSN
jgi:hypothetical protein